MKELEELLEAEIDWQKSETDDYVFTAEFHNKQFKLQLNDFPEEPLCTVICGNEKQDLDNIGEKWTLPKHRGE